MHVITNKIAELSGIAAVNNPSLIIFTESWLHSIIPDAAVKISHKLNSYYRDRPTPDGGILAYVNNQIPTTCLSHLGVDDKGVMAFVKTTWNPKAISFNINYFPIKNRKASMDCLDGQRKVAGNVKIKLEARKYK